MKEGGAHPAPFSAVFRLFFSCFRGPTFGASVAGRADRNLRWPGDSQCKSGDSRELIRRKTPIFLVAQKGLNLKFKALRALNLRP